METLYRFTETERVSVAVTFYTRIRILLGWNSVGAQAILIFRGFLQSLQATAGILAIASFQRRKIKNQKYEKPVNILP